MTVWLKFSGIYWQPWPDMTDIINILIRGEFAYHVEFGFICDVVNPKLCEYKVGYLQLALVVGSKTKSTDVFNVLLD